jgi:DNA-binding response OmpR family regulator
MTLQPGTALLADVSATMPPSTGRVGSLRRKVLLIDGEGPTAHAAQNAFSSMRLAVRVAPDGNAALAALAEEEPDVIVMELELGGALAGKDVIDIVRATRGWTDIPVVLFTHVPIANLADARSLHGADEFVPKGAGPDALMAAVLSLLGRQSR